MSSHTNPRRVGVLSLHNSAETKAICNAVEAMGHDPVWLREDNLTSRIVDGEVRPTPDVDVVVNRLLVTKADRPLDDLSVAAAFEGGRPMLNPPSAVVGAVNKYAAATRLARAGVPVPDAFLGLSATALDEGREHVGTAAVHKTAIGTNGAGMSRVEDGSLSPRVANRRTFLQRYVGGEGHPYDVRVYVVGGRVLGAMRRSAPDDEWRTNVALGGSVEDVSDELPEAARDVARRATAAFDLDYAGVDLVPDRTANAPDWRVLEVNTTAGFKRFFEATGVSPAASIARLAVERAGGAVERTAVERVRETLDDSVPACKPATATDGGDGDTVALTQRVDVGGTDGIETVTAKSDTGAKRTCLDIGLAGRVGAGPIGGTTRVRQASGSARRPVVDVEVGIEGDWETVAVSLADRSGMNHPVLLGRDVLAGRQVVVDRKSVTAEE